LTRITTCLILNVFYLLPVLSYCQGNGADGAITVNATTYTDNSETNLSATTASGAASITVISAASFAAGERILIIQAEGIGIGEYEENTISSIAGNVLTLAHGTGNTYTVVAGTSVVEVMKIMQYTNITINSGGILTAHAWNGSTGGTMYFYASGTITVNAGGKITMDDLGFLGGAGGTGGIGSAGLTTIGTGATIAGASGNNGGNGAGSSGGTGAGGGGNGGAGGQEDQTVGTAGSAGSAGQGPAANGSSYPNVLEMGGGGRGASGGTGGYGGGPGGGGGADNNNVCGCGLDGTNGSDGTIGSTGSTGSSGGNGGGIMVIYVNTITGSGTVTAKGAQGGAGGQGGTGGAGGDGGYGAYSGCGGTGGGGGGGGDGGSGGAGGTGSNGGVGGTIWLTAFTNTLSLATSASGGAAGAGGLPGAGGAGGFGGPSYSITCSEFGSGASGVAGNTGSGTNGGSGSAGSAGGSGSNPASTGGSPLPIQLLSFTAIYSQSQRVVYVNWSTVSEKNNKSFTVEKTVDGENWYVVTELAGTGNSNEVKNYSTIDNYPYDGVSYYKLKQTDDDGSFTYSPVLAINVQMKEQNDISIIPNPANKVITVSYISNVICNSTIKVFDNTGKLIDTIEQPTQSGKNSAEINVSDYNNGVYLISIDNSSTHYSAKLIVSH